MKLNYTILHISDLHKPQKSSYKNLCESLFVDSDHYEKDGIQKPEIIVVSGDLIEGSKNNDAEQAAEEIRSQYRDVAGFLNELVNYFLGGDKSRIVIVPGNHDVYRNASSASMKKESVNGEIEIRRRRKLVGIGEQRWSWKDLSFYSIENQEQYETRFDLFVEFYNNFYAELRPKRTWEVPCEKKAQIIDLPEYNLCFLALNSCYRLDHLNDSGSIFPSALTSVQRKLISVAKRGSLVIGVWHHHTYGLPYENNYLDYRILQSLIDAQVKIGLYGHQHLTSILDEYHDLTRKERILLISSGSLYGNRDQLLTGCPRQYGLISLEFQEEGVALTLHVRKDPTNFDIPSWCQGQIGTSSLVEYHEQIKLCKLKIESFIQNIDYYVQQTHDYQTGYTEILKYTDLDRETCLKFADSYLSHITNYSFIQSVISVPETDFQFMYLLNAAVELRDTKLINRLKTDARYESVAGVLMNYLREKIRDLV